MLLINLVEYVDQNSENAIGERVGSILSLKAYKNHGRLLNNARGHNAI